MSDYLEEAAQQLRKALGCYERVHHNYPSNLAEARLRIAEAFARLAAIERGILPAEQLATVLAEALKADERR